MSQLISIEVDAATIDQGKKITGNICFLIDYHRYFPDQVWDDFVVTVLGWWIRELKGVMVSDPGRSYRFEFMDGPPVVLAKKVNEKEVELSFCSQGLPKIDWSGLFAIEQLRDSLLSASKKIIRTIDRRQWDSKEAEELKKLVVSLEKYPL